MNVVEYFGPRVAKTKLSVDETKSLEAICVPNNQHYNDRLVGYLKEEYGILEELKDLSVYKTIINNVNNYITQIDSGNYVRILDQIPNNNFLEMTDAWYNEQKAMEHNPIHTHITSADIVCVIFPKILLDNEIKYYENNEGSEQKGQLYFMYGEPEKNAFGRSGFGVVPEEGDMYIFPASLNHYTSPVLGKSVRFSISCNFSFTSLSKRALGKVLSKKEKKF